MQPPRLRHQSAYQSACPTGEGLAGLISSRQIIERTPATPGTCIRRSVRKLEKDFKSVATTLISSRHIIERSPATPDTNNRQTDRKMEKDFKSVATTLSR